VLPWGGCVGGWGCQGLDRAATEEAVMRERLTANTRATQLEAKLGPAIW
jgi:hypothetical protein